MCHVRTGNPRLFYEPFIDTCATVWTAAGWVTPQERMSLRAASSIYIYVVSISMNVRIRLNEHALMLIRLNGQNVLRVKLHEQTCAH